MVTFEPVGSTYQLLLGRVLWPLGRGFSRQIGKINDVSVRTDGTLAVRAEGNDESFKTRWELVVDPRADYLVRSAQRFRRDAKRPDIIIETSGVLEAGGRLTPHTARWVEGVAAQSDSISVSSVSATADVDLIERTEKRLDSLPAFPN